MAYSGRPSIMPGHLRQGSTAGSQGPAAPSPALTARIEEKKRELANLKDLARLSAGVADQMQTLEEKLSTLSDGTEAVALVLSNWTNVLEAINMASSTHGRVSTFLQWLTSYRKDSCSERCG
jgi:DASH complex subunit DAD2